MIIIAPTKVFIARPVRRKDGIFLEWFFFYQAGHYCTDDGLGLTFRRSSLAWPADDG